MNTNNTLRNILPANGEVYLFPELFNLEESNRLWNSLRECIAWKHEPIVIMGRKIMQPRLTAWYGEQGKSYKYSGTTMIPNPWNEDLLFIKARIETVSGHTFNSALLNFYRDGKDSVGWHSDSEKSLGINPVIGSVSFGTPRNFHLRRKVDKTLKLKLPLTHGSFLLMKGETQHHWSHSIQKEPKLTDGRINITSERL